MQVLIALDGSAESSLALRTAEGIAWPTGSVLHVLTVMPTDIELYGGPWTDVGYIQPDDLRERLAAERAGLLDEAVRSLRGTGVEVVARMRTGRAATVILDTADELDADLIVLGARGHGALERALLGSVSSAVVDHARCAVLVARRAAVDRVLVGADGSVAALAALALVGRRGLFPAADVRVIHAIDPQPSWWLGAVPGDVALAAETIADTADAARDRAVELTDAAAALLRPGVGRVDTCVREGAAPRVILEEAARWGADLVVVGTRGHGALRRLVLGSTARAVLEHADASVLIARGAKAKRRRSEPAAAVAGLALA